MHPVSEHLTCEAYVNRPEGKIDRNTIIVRGFNIPLSTMERLSRRKINGETLDLNYNVKGDGFDTQTVYSIQQQRNTHSSQVHMEQPLA